MSLRNINDDNPRIRMMREDLKIQITDTFPTPGTLLVVHPKNSSVQFTPEYCEWIAENLKTLLPNGVKAMVLSQDITDFDILHPKDISEEYKRGWWDAITCLKEINGYD